MADVNFEFGRTSASEEFFKRYPEFNDALERLVGLGNNCFGREYQPGNRAEDICFRLGHTCREDFGQVVFLAVHGYATGASKLLRGLYERTLALEYIARNPDKAERFVRFAAIQEHAALEGALKSGATEEQFDEVMAPHNSVAEIRSRYKDIKPEFQVTDCKTCKTTRRAGSWDVDIATMASSLGGTYQNLYLGSYAIPNLHVHATLASVMQDHPDETTLAEQRRQEIRFTMVNACTLFTLVAETQSNLFGLNLTDDIEACRNDIPAIWIPLDEQTAP